MSKQFLCILRNSTGACNEPTPSQMEEMYAKFQSWHKKFNDNIVDMGGKLVSDGKILTADGLVDGPFMEVKEIIGGFMVVAADNVDEAADIVKACPPVASSLGSTSVEIRELARG